MYATVADLRSEGVTATEASDARLDSLLREASEIIDRVTGWFFEPRTCVFRMSGRGTPSIEPPVPPIALTRLAVGEARLNLLPADMVVVVGAPVRAGFDGPRITLRHGLVFHRGEGNIIAEGRWGFTSEDGTPEGRTPSAIRRACMLLVLRTLPPLTDDAADEARDQWRLLEQQTRDQRVRLDTVRWSGPRLTGDPNIDSLLQPYLRPMALGAA